MSAEPAREGIRSVAIEAALADLERALVRDRCHVVVSASSGPAKRLLLGALAERVASALRVIPLPPAEDGLDLCARILRELGEPCGEDAEETLIELVRRLAGRRSALALVAGDARALSEPILRQLGRLAAQTRPGLRLVLVSDGTGRSDRDAIAEFMALLGIGAVKVVLDAPLHRERTATVALAAPAPAPRACAGATAGARPHDARRPVPPLRRPVRRATRLALAGLAVAAVGFAVDRVEISRAQESATAHPAQPAPRADVAPRRAQPARVAQATAPRAATPKPVSEAAPAPVIALAAARAVAPAPESAATPEIAPVASAPPEPVAVAAAVGTIGVSLNAEPWASIEIDGLDVGVTPMADVRLSEGPHRFRARFADGRVIERTVRVDALRDHVTFP